MKSNELMPGDWVYYGKMVVPILQLSINREYPSIKPIPITPEILEKNGFIYKDGLWMWLKSKGKVYIRHLANKWSIEAKNELAKKDEFGRADLVSYCRDWAQQFYIHDLQHALKLCGIDKEIVI